MACEFDPLWSLTNNQVFPGQERMAEEIGSSKSTVGRAVQELEEQGWLEIQRRGQGKTNLYILKYKVSGKTATKWGRFPPVGIKIPTRAFLVSHRWVSERG